MDQTSVAMNGFVQISPRSATQSQFCAGSAMDIILLRLRLVSYQFHTTVATEWTLCH